MRPVYETEADRIRERAVALKVKAWLAGSAAHSATAVKLKPFSPVDFAICKHDGTVVAFVEVKVRTCRSDEYDTYLLSMDKAIALRRLAQDTNGMLVYLAVEWMDRVGVFLVRADTVFSRPMMGGRWDRGDGQDVEPVVHIPVSAFETVVVNSGQEAAA
jgi:hypothetical protein